MLAAQAQARRGVGLHGAVLEGPGEMLYVSHPRGFMARFNSRAMARLLAEPVLAELEATGTPARVDVDDLEAVVANETVGPRSACCRGAGGADSAFPSCRRDQGFGPSIYCARKM